MASTMVSKKAASPSTHAAAPVVAWFEVVGKDGGKLRSFYSQLFGWDTADVPGGDYGVTDSPKVGVGGGVGASHGDGRAHVTIFVEVPDVDAALRASEKLGAKVVSQPMTFPDMRPQSEGKGEVTFASFADPAGNVVGLCKGIVNRET